MQEFYTNAFLLAPLSKNIQKHFLYLVNFLLKHIQDLDNQSNGTSKEFSPLTFDKYLNMMYGTYVKTEYDIIPFCYYE